MSDKYFKYQMVQGCVAVAYRKCRSTVLSKFSEDHQGAIDDLVGNVDIHSQAMEVTNQLAKRVLSGVSAKNLEAIMGFLCDRIHHFEGLEVDGEAVEWPNLDAEERLDIMDMEISPLDVMGLFLAFWIHYQGLGSRVVANKG